MTSDGFAWIYPKLTIETLAFAIATDIIFDPANHEEFNIHTTSYDELVDALRDDLMDLVHNGNEDDWLIYFYDPNDTETFDKLTVQLGEMIAQDQNDKYYKFMDELSERVGTIIATARNGIPGRFGFTE